MLDKSNASNQNLNISLQSIASQKNSRKSTGVASRKTNNFLRPRVTIFNQEARDGGKTTKSKLQLNKSTTDLDNQSINRSVILPKKEINQSTSRRRQTNTKSYLNQSNISIAQKNTESKSQTQIDVQVPQIDMSFISKGTQQINSERRRLTNLMQARRNRSQMLSKSRIQEDGDADQLNSSILNHQGLLNNLNHSQIVLNSQPNKLEEAKLRFIEQRDKRKYDNRVIGFYREREIVKKIDDIVQSKKDFDMSCERITKHTLNSARQQLIQLSQQRAGSKDKLDQQQCLERQYPKVNPFNLGFHSKTSEQDHSKQTKSGLMTQRTISEQEMGPGPGVTKRQNQAMNEQIDNEELTSGDFQYYTARNSFSQMSKNRMMNFNFNKDNRVLMPKRQYLENKIKSQPKTIIETQQCKNTSDVKQEILKQKPEPNPIVEYLLIQLQELSLFKQQNTQLLPSQPTTDTQTNSVVEQQLLQLTLSMVNFLNFHNQIMNSETNQLLNTTACNDPNSNATAINTKMREQADNDTSLNTISNQTVVQISKRRKWKVDKMVGDDTPSDSLNY
ncbi:UNKNOWN [Stylonychia lemnae]|uniref:Uncharacterized protein n=1 Tax=Stylonychia lemnae TaxID=5949 RepID=A0A077ZYB6_STYLE|nr:UNKNOWN [Stylonychia lemnae]|eukprot:CDW74835.1 UNKNOWN [Stylonychia lemnae]